MITTDRIRPRTALGAALLLGLSLAGCGKEDPLGSGGGDVGGGGTPTVTVRMGNGTGATFVNGAIGIAAPNLSAGGTTGLQVTFVDQDGVLYDDESISVSFASTCIASGLATVTTPVTTTTGLATATYVAAGCSGTDTITASATANGRSLTATGTVTVAQAVVGSIAFVSATPSNIGLRGTGGTGRSETSVVVFQVLDSTGGVMIGQTVSFALNTTVGGISLTPASATTDAQGRVQTIVQAGTVATSVRVTASTTQGAITIQTQSDQLTVTTGVPDQDSVSLSATMLNPEALNVDGVQVPITMRLADRFNNPVPDGTAVTFTTEGGSIDGQCTTVGGSCTVNWRSQNPRPAGVTFGQAARVTILATAIGEESFVDLNGNGVFDDGDSFAGQDLPEAWRDDDEDGAYDAATEPFLDFNSDEAYNAADGFWNGLLCSDTTGRCGTPGTTPTSIAVRATLVLSMSGSLAQLVTLNGAAPPATGSDIGGAGSYVFQFADANGNPMPSGTTVEFSLEGATLAAGASSTVGSTNAVGGTFHTVFIDPDDDIGPATLTVTVTTPAGGVTEFIFRLTGV